MTEQQGTAGSGIDQGPDHPQWRVEGAESYGDGGLGDTVVRIPRITDDEPVSEPKPRSSQTRHPAASEGAGKPAGQRAEAAPAKSESTIAMPVRPESHAASVPSGPQSVAPSPFAAPGPTAFIPTPSAEPLAAGATPVAAAKPKPSGLRRTRKARLRLSRIDPWSVMKTSFLFSIAFGIMFWVAVSVVWTVIVNSGLFDAINDAIVNVISSPNAQSSFRIEDYISTNKVLGISALLAVINVVISTALGTLTAFLYNLSANILGGIELTLAED